VPGPAFARLANVSSTETALNRRLDDEGLNRMRDWQVGLAEYVEDLLAREEGIGPAWIG